MNCLPITVHHSPFTKIKKSPTPLVREMELSQRTGQLFYVLLGEGRPLGITLTLNGLCVKDGEKHGA